MNRQKHLSTALAMAVLASGLTLTGLSADAGELSAQQIRDGLKVSRTRSLSPSDRPTISADDLAAIKRVSGQSRSLSAADRDQMAAIATKRPKINLEINFDFNSAELSPSAEPQLKSLGEALTSSDLKGTTVMLGGHTDAKGSDAYNQGLSERRAEAVKRYLIDKYHIPATELVAAGYGEQGLKNPSNPLAAENRRVEIVNLAEREQASK
ncbi:flagellar motor protein MotB [Rhodopseudomonas palustris]|uniref:Flagellar motor protein MotB n=2 Tax=Nitrobacteraceae TaxID=41294 RepID=A0A0D7F5D8_RHOPL|nr:flagellar motor protein MotB [Rhodopseudomonas palustris]